MRTRTNCFLALISLAVLPAASAQMVDSPEETAYTIKFTSLPFVEQRVVKGAPYSGREVELQFRTLADGSRLILYQMERLVCRDSAGRFRWESPPRAATPLIRQEPPGQFRLVRIDDPVSGYHYVLDPVNRVAHRFIPRRVSSAPAPTGGTRLPSVPPPTGGTASAVSRPEGRRFKLSCWEYGRFPGLPRQASEGYKPTRRTPSRSCQPSTSLKPGPMRRQASFCSGR